MEMEDGADMSEESKTIAAIIKQAIAGEEDAYAVYSSAAKIVKAAGAKALLLELAKDEQGHKAKLEGLLKKGISWTIAEGQFKRVADFKLGDHLVSKPVDENADLQQVLTTAIQREKESHELYSTMGSVSCDDTVRNLFEFLANEELTHKRRLEALYEEIVYKDF
jgi:rubrerythrin